MPKKEQQLCYLKYNLGITMSSNILKLLAGESFITVNKQIIKLFGTDVAILIGVFCSMQSYHCSADNPWFYKTYSDIEAETGLTLHNAQKAVRILKQSGLLHSKQEGIPCKMFYSISEETLVKYLTSATPSTTHGSHRELNIGHTENIFNNNTVNNNTVNNKEEDTNVSYTVSEETDNVYRGSKRSIPEIEDKLVSVLEWEKYTPFLYRVNKRFKNMSTMKFPKNYEPLAPVSSYLDKDITKSLFKAVQFISETLKGKFCNIYSVSKADIKSKYPTAYKFLTSGVILGTGEIEGALEVYSDLFEDGNWPPDKKTLTTDFNSWVFNPKTKNSWFIYCLEQYLSGKRDFLTKEFELSRESKNNLIKMSDMFPNNITEILDVFTQWWSWMQKRVEQAARDNSTDDEDYRSHWGPFLEDSITWIDLYTNFIWDKGKGTIPVELLRGGSKWSLSFIRHHANISGQDWKLSSEEEDRLYAN